MGSGTPTGQTPLPTHNVLERYFDLASQGVILNSLVPQGQYHTLKDGGLLPPLLEPARAPGNQPAPPACEDKARFRGAGRDP